MTKKLPDAAVLITGGAKRLGRVITLALAQAGYDIALHYHTSHKEAQETASHVKALGRTCHLFQADLQQVDTLPGLMSQVVDTMPHCSVLINNASLFERVPFMETTPAAYHKHLTINAAAPFFLIQAFATQCKAAAQVINILDTHITRKNSPYCSYLLSKQLLMHITEMAAVELGPRIRVNAVCPGIVLPSGDHDTAYMQKKAKTVPLATTATPDMVAEAVLHLLQLPSLTGQMLFVDGGERLI